jgi:hypothetical protein
MKQDLLPSVDQVSVVDTTPLLMMMVKHGEEEGLCGMCCPSSSRHSMSATYGPQDIISLVTPRLGGDNTCKPILYYAKGLKEITCMSDPQRSLGIIVTIFVTTRLVMVEVVDELTSLL